MLTLGRNFRCYWVIIWFYKADTASSTRCYCSISRINNRRFSPDNNQSAWTMCSLKSTDSHSTLSHTDTYRLGASLCYSATSSFTGKNVRHLEWVRNSCYCIEVLPRVSIGSGNGLPPVQCQAITWTNTDSWSIGPLGTNFSEIWIKIQDFSFMKMHFKMLSVKRRPFCPGGDELNTAISQHWFKKWLSTGTKQT